MTAVAALAALAVLIATLVLVIQTGWVRFRSARETVVGLPRLMLRCCAFPRRCLVPLTIGLLFVGCGGSSELEKHTSTTGSSASSELSYLALGDSWPEGAHCGYCRTFAGLYADGLASQTGRRVVFEDITGAAQPYFELGGGSASLLKALRSDPSTRRAVAKADVIMIATGPNEGAAYEAAKAGTCGGDDDMACFRTQRRMWERNFDAILDEIEGLRAGKPTAIRLVSAANPFVSDPSMAKGLPEDFATKEGALIFMNLNDTLCSNAARHDAVCVDVRPILNGRTLDRPVDENSPKSMRAVAKALLATKLPELGNPTK
jgi:hypothetical protein